MKETVCRQPNLTFFLLNLENFYQKLCSSHYLTLKETICDYIFTFFNPFLGCFEAIETSAVYNTCSVVFRTPVIIEMTFKFLQYPKNNTPTSVDKISLCCSTFVETTCSSNKTWTQEASTKQLAQKRMCHKSNFLGSYVYLVLQLALKAI